MIMVLITNPKRTKHGMNWKRVQAGQVLRFIESRQDFETATRQDFGFVHHKQRLHNPCDIAYKWC